MKKILLLLSLMLSISIWAQTDGITYQAVILDTKVQELPGQDRSGNVLVNTPITLRFTIGSNGSVVFRETHFTETDSFGMVNVVIGEGEEELNSFMDISWDGSPKNLTVEISRDGGFETLSDQPLLFVPYAFHRNIIATGDMLVEGAILFEGDLEVEGTTTLKNSLTVANETPTNLTGTIVVDGMATLNNNLEVTNKSDTKLTGMLTVEGMTSLENELNVGGIAQLRQDLAVNGNTNFNNSVQVNNDASTFLSGTLAVEGETQFNNAISVSTNNSTNLGGSLTVEKQATFNDDFIINGQTIINNGIEVNGNSQFNNNVAIAQDLTVSGVVYAENQLEVQNGASTLLSGLLKVEGATLMTNTLTVSDHTLLEGNLQVNGNVTGSQELQIDGVANMNNTFNVNNGSRSNLTGDLSVGGISELNNSLTVTNGSETTLTGTLLVNDMTTLNSDLLVANGSTTQLSGVLNVDGITNLENTLNVNNGSSTNLSGELVVAGATTMNGGLLIDGDLELSQTATMAGLVVSNSEGVMGDHVALFENTGGSDADGIAIIIDRETLSIDNHFVSFYGANDHLAGRIESYDLAGGDLFESFPVPDFDTLFNVFDFSQVLEWEEPSLAFSGGTLPSANFSRGSLPSLSINFTGFSFDFGRGSLPSLSFNSGTLPTANFDVGNLDLNFDGFFAPDAGAEAGGQIGAMVGWGARNGYPGYLPVTPWKIALTPLVLAAKQISRNQGVVYGSKGADYAEWLQKEDEEEKYVFGEVVGVKGGKISRNTVDADQVMTISLNPIVLGNMPDKERAEAYEKVGFLGQVPALVIGEVAIGDFVIASGNNDGYGIAKSSEDLSIDDLKNVIGRAWSKSDPSGLSIINVSVGLKTNEWITIFEKQEIEINTMKQKLEELSELNSRLQQLESKLELIGIN